VELKEIENKIACNEMNAAQTFTQMKQHIDAANKDGYNKAVCDVVDHMNNFDSDAETIRQQFLSDHPITIEQ